VRAYSNANRWMKAARHRIQGGRFAMRSFAGAVVAGLLTLGFVGIVAPNSFGPSTTGRLERGPALWGLLALVAINALIAVARARYLRGLYIRLREPFVRRISYDSHFEGAADALADCPAPMRTRWAMRWIYVPALLVVAGFFFAFSAAYFGIGAILSLGAVGWGTPIIAAANVVLSLLCFRAAATRIATWRLAVSVYRDVTGSYAD
jgi:protein-S-isoprenylcysteine O-methyltransferase Ste14